LSAPALKPREGEEAEREDKRSDTVLVVDLRHARVESGQEAWKGVSRGDEIGDRNNHEYDSENNRSPRQRFIHVITVARILVGDLEYLAD
jgi:hypothetical protein